MLQTLRSAFAVAAASVALTVVAAPAQAADNIPAITDDYLFSKSLGQFMSIRGQAPYSGQLDWSSDGCTGAPDSPFGFKFKPACNRHDFGYRNYRKQGRFTSANRARIDGNFKSDLYTQCDGGRACKIAADLYYNAVRKVG